MEHSHQDSQTSPRSSSRPAWILLAFLAIGGFFLLTEHRAHLFGILPFLLVLACPLMHLFHGHGNHGGHGADKSGETQPNSPAVPTHDHGGKQS